MADVRGVEELFEECSEIDDMAELFADEAKVSADLEKMRGGRDELNKVLPLIKMILGSAIPIKGWSAEHLEELSVEIKACPRSPGFVVDLREPQISVFVSIHRKNTH